MSPFNQAPVQTNSNSACGFGVNFAPPSNHSSYPTASQFPAQSRTQFTSNSSLPSKNASQQNLYPHWQNSAQTHDSKNINSNLNISMGQRGNSRDIGGFGKNKSPPLIDNTKSQAPNLQTQYQSTGSIHNHITENGGNFNDPVKFHTGNTAAATDNVDALLDNDAIWEQLEKQYFSSKSNIKSLPSTPSTVNPLLDEELSVSMLYERKLSHQLQSQSQNLQNHLQQNISSNINNHGSSYGLVANAAFVPKREENANRTKPSSNHMNIPTQYHGDPIQGMPGASPVGIIYCSQNHSIN